LNSTTTVSRHALIAVFTPVSGGLSASTSPTVTFLVDKPDKASSLAANTNQTFKTAAHLRLCSLRSNNHRSGSAMASTLRSCRPQSSKTCRSRRRLIRSRPTSPPHHRSTCPDDIRGGETAITAPPVPIPGNGGHLLANDPSGEPEPGASSITARDGQIMRRAAPPKCQKLLVNTLASPAWPVFG
jgi:hypothetical protein